MKERMKVLVAYDGSENAQYILDDLQRAGLPSQAEAVVISVADVDVPLVPDYAITTTSANTRLNAVLRAREHAFYDAVMGQRNKAFLAVHDARQSAIRASEQIQATFPEWKVSAEAHADSPSSAVIKKAHEWAADLIVVGTHRRSALERLILSSVSQRIVSESGHSVRVARNSSRNSDMPARILIGLDGSSFAEKAVWSVAMRDWPADSRVMLVTATKSSGPYGAAPYEQFNQAAEMQKGVEAILLEAGLKVSSVIKEGDATSVLISEAEIWEADCIFVGSRGLHNVLKRLFLGSVSAAVIANANCSVEVVH